jgi:hypothetical protein
MRAPGMNVPIEKRPSVTTTAGSSASSCRRRYGAQAAISSGCGSRLSGGRHLTTFVMKTSSRRQPIDASSLTSRSPPDLGGDLLERRPALGVGHAVASVKAA